MGGISFSDFLKFTRFTVSLAVTFSSWAAAVAFSCELSVAVLPAIAGIFLLASGASALNQVQEKRTDQLMKRTSTRPMPSGKLTHSLGLLLSFFLILSGLVLIFFTAPLICLLLGILNILWYNGLYTYLKKRSAFAVVPGSLTGAIPVLMGWTAAGGSLSSIEPWLIAFFIFMWQIPHFWLLILNYGYQYQKAGLPVLTDLFNDRQMKNIIFAWLLAASVSSLFLMSLGTWFQPLVRSLIIILNFLLLVFAFIALFFLKKNHHRQLFVLLNVFMLVVLFLLVTERISL